MLLYSDTVLEKLNRINIFEQTAWQYAQWHMTNKLTWCMCLLTCFFSFGGGGMLDWWWCGILEYHILFWAGNLFCWISFLIITEVGGGTQSLLKTNNKQNPPHTNKKKFQILKKQSPTTNSEANFPENNSIISFHTKRMSTYFLVTSSALPVSIERPEAPPANP